MALKNPIKAHVFRVVYKSIKLRCAVRLDVIDDCITTPDAIKTALKDIGMIVSCKRVWAYVENPLLE